MKSIMFIILVIDMFCLVIYNRYMYVFILFLICDNIFEFYGQWNGIYYNIDLKYINEERFKVFKYFGEEILKQFKVRG